MDSRSRPRRWSRPARTGSSRRSAASTRRPVRPIALHGHSGPVGAEAGFNERLAGGPGHRQRVEADGKLTPALQTRVLSRADHPARLHCLRLNMMILCVKLGEIGLDWILWE